MNGTQTNLTAPGPAREGGKPIGVVLTGGDFMALGVLRTLARKNIPILLLEHEHSISRYSIYPKRVRKAPRPDDPDAYARFLVETAESEGIRGWVIIPNSDELVYVLSKHRDRLSPYYRIPTPGWDVIRDLYIKKNTYQLAERLGIPIPATRYPQSVEEAAALDIPYPAVLKPSIRDHYYNQTRIKAHRVENRGELVRVFRRMAELIPPSEILVQDMVPGGAKELYSFCPFFKDGGILAGITARRARQHPMDFGHASTYAEEVEIPELRDLARRLLGAIGYYGLAEVEFMRDTRDGVYRLIEVNPRVWGWHALAIASGVDLPYYLYADMTGSAQTPPPAAGGNARWLHFTTDLPTAALEIARGRMSARSYLASLRGARDAVFSLRDPLPFLAELLMIPYLYWKRGF